MDELEIVKLVAIRLGSAKISYMVTGSIAMNFYAQPRLTRDVDVVVEIGVAQVDRIVQLFADDFVCEAEAVADAVRRGGMFNIIHYESVVKVDFIVRKDSPYRIEEMRRRRAVDLDGTTVWVVAAEDLILSCGASFVNDTPAHVARLQGEMLMRRSGIERMRMGASMFETARRMMRASLGDPSGTDDSAEMRVQLFLRTYGQDFEPAVRAHIVARLRLWPGKAAR